jgi:hypothetical protein
MEQVAHGEQIIAENCLLLNPDRKTIVILLSGTGRNFYTFKVK